MGGKDRGEASGTRALFSVIWLLVAAAITVCGDSSAVEAGESEASPDGTEGAAGPSLKAFDVGGRPVRFGMSSVDGLVPGHSRAEGAVRGDVVVIDIDSESVESAGIPDDSQRWIVSGSTLLNEWYLVADLCVCDSPFEMIDDSEFCESGNPISREVWAQQRGSGEWLRTVIDPDVAVPGASLLAGGRLDFNGRTASAMYVGQLGSLYTLDLDAAFQRGTGAVIEQDGRLDARCGNAGMESSVLEVVDGHPTAVVVVESNSGDTERLPLPDGVRLLANAMDPPLAVHADWYCGVKGGYFLALDEVGSYRLWNLRDPSKGPWEIADTSPEIAAAQGRVAVLLRSQRDDPKNPYRLSVIDRDGVQRWVDLGKHAAADSGITVFDTGGAIFVGTQTGGLYVVS